MRLRVVYSAILAGLTVACVDTAPSGTKGTGTPEARVEPWADAGGSKRPPFAPPTESTRDAASSGSDDIAVDTRAPMQPSAAGAKPSGHGGEDAGVTASSQPPGVAEAGVNEAPLEPGALVISELMIDPKTLSDAEGEWIELYNPGSRVIDLQRCELDDGGKTARRWMPNLRIEPRAYVTIARQSTPGFRASATAALSLTNSADSLAVRCGGVEIDRVSYSKAAGYPLVSGASLALDPTRLDARANDEASAWCTGQQSYGPELGSPGLPNPPCHAEPGSDAGSSDAPDEMSGEPESA